MNNPRAPQPRPDKEQQVFSVSELTELIKQALTSLFPAVWVSGELSDVSQPQSGHVYFTLKDSHAQLRGVIWRSFAQRIRFDLEDGQQVVCLGEIDVYAPRGGYQLIVRQIQPLGAGALQLALRQLQQRLEAEGLFDPRHKQPLPRFPQRIAVVTSPTGAAIRDFLEVLRRRWRGVEVLVVPSRVQGAAAGPEIAQAIRLANRLQPPADVIVVTRGGGSLEDLWCFNEEVVVRAVFESRSPVVSAVGHEIDVTLVDLAADVRALTPSEAAERVVPSQLEVRAQLDAFQQRLATSLRRRAERARLQVDSLASRPALLRPLDRVREAARRVDELQLRAARAVLQALEDSRSQLRLLSGKLDVLSPLNVLQRGYSVTQLMDQPEQDPADLENHTKKTPLLVTSADQLAPGDQILTTLARGRVLSRVTQTEQTPFPRPRNEQEQ